MRNPLHGMRAAMLSVTIVATASLGALVAAPESAHPSVRAASPQHSTGAAASATPVRTTPTMATARTTATGTMTAVPTAMASASTAPVMTTHTPAPQITGTAVSPLTAGGMATATAAATGALQVRVAPRTVRGGRTTTCRIRSNPQTPAGVVPTGCVVISVTTVPRAILLYTLTYPDAPGVRHALGTPSLRDRFKDTTDARGYSVHAFTVPYVPAAAIVVRVTVTARMATGPTMAAATTQFTVTP